MTKVYHGTVKGYLELALQLDELRSFNPIEISDFVNQITPLLRGYSEWLDNRLQRFSNGEATVYLSDSKKNALDYAITYPEIVTSCIIRLSECIEGGKIKAADTENITPQLKNLYTYFQKKGTPLVVTLELPNSHFTYTGIPNEIRLVKPVRIAENKAVIEQVTEAHLFFLYYERLKEAMKQKGIQL